MRWFESMMWFENIFIGDESSKTRGETIVEVLLATVILSVILAAAYTLSNRATRIGQSSIERTEAVNMVESMTEVLRGVSSVRGEAWNEIIAMQNTNAPSYADPNVCEPTVGNTYFYLNIDNVSDLEDVSLVENDDMYEDGFFQVWIEAYSPAGQGYIDFHVRSCWEGLSAAEYERVTAVLRLNTGSAGTWSAP